MADRKIYKTTFKLVVLSEDESLGFASIESVLYEIECGSSIGNVTTERLNDIIPPEKVEAELRAIGNDGTFFTAGDDDEDD